MNRTRWTILLASLGAFALLLLALREQPVLVELGTVRKGPFELERIADGKTRVRERHLVAAPLAGDLLRPSLKAGDRVRRGQVLAILLPGDPALLDARAERELKERLGAAEAALSRARVVQSQAEANLAHARLEEGRSSRLTSEGAMSQQAQDRNALALRLAQRDQEASAFQAHAAEHEVSQARAALARASAGAKGGRWELRSPVEGTVLRLLRESEGPVTTGTPLIELGRPDDLEVVVDLPTEEAAALPDGATARLERWGGALPVPARVRRVEPSAFTKVSPLGVEEQRVNVILDLSAPPRGLGDAFQVEVHIQTERVESALVVPSSALFRTEAGWCVFRVVSGRARATRITLGSRGPRESRIVSGLSEGEQVVLYPSDTVRDGARVKSP
jgi:HlyD family secretion protein